MHPRCNCGKKAYGIHGQYIYMYCIEVFQTICKTSRIVSVGDLFPNHGPSYLKSLPGTVGSTSVT